MTPTVVELAKQVAALGEEIQQLRALVLIVGVAAVVNALAGIFGGRR